MDPINNSTSTPNPVPNSNPTPSSDPVPHFESTPSSDPIPTFDPALVSNVASAPVEPVTPPSPVSTPNGQTMEPVKPTPLATPVNPVFQPSGMGITATEPIMRPEPAPAPDPIEQELNAPMTPASPVPGSIGSAISGPKSNDLGSQNTPSVSFEDPAMKQNPMEANKPIKKKTSKLTWILLAVLAFVVSAALIVILVITLLTPTDNIKNDTPVSGEVSLVEDEPEDNQTSGNGNTFETLSCKRAMNATELSTYDDVSSGNIEISIDFYDDKLDTISIMKSVTSSLESESSGTTSKAGKNEASAKDISSENAKDYYLNVDENGEVELDKTSIQTNLESLAFTCEIL